MSRKFSSNHRERYHYSKTANTPPPKQSVTSIEPLIDIIVVILDGEYSKKEVKQVIDHYFNYLRSWFDRPFTSARFLIPGIGSFEIDDNAVRGYIWENLQRLRKNRDLEWAKTLLREYWRIKDLSRYLRLTRSKYRNYFATKF